MGRHSLLTSKDKEYIMNNLSTKTIAEFAEELNAPYENVRLFCATRNLKPVKKYTRRTVKNKISRHPGQYSNPDFSSLYL